MQLFAVITRPQIHDCFVSFSLMQLAWLRIKHRILLDRLIDSLLVVGSELEALAVTQSDIKDLCALVISVVD